MSVNEQERVLRAKGGDTDAFEMLVIQHGQYVYNLAIRILQDAQEAEDLSQEAFLRVWRALPHFRAESSFRTWLYRIVTNLCYDRLPRLKKELAALDPDVVTNLTDDHMSPEASILTDELEARLHKMIHDMPEGYRLLFTLRHLQGMSYSEIAEVTGMPLGTVKTGIFRGRKLLKAEIEAYDSENE